MLKPLEPKRSPTGKFLMRDEDTRFDVAITRMLTKENRSFAYIADNLNVQRKWVSWRALALGIESERARMRRLGEIFDWVAIGKQFKLKRRFSTVFKKYAKGICSEEEFRRLLNSRRISPNRSVEYRAKVIKPNYHPKKAVDAGAVGEKFPSGCQARKLELGYHCPKCGFNWVSSWQKPRCIKYPITNAEFAILNCCKGAGLCLGDIQHRLHRPHAELKTLLDGMVKEGFLKMHSGDDLLSPSNYYQRTAKGVRAYDDANQKV